MRSSASYSCKRLVEKMKKAFLTILITCTAALTAWAGTPAKLERLVQQYKGQEGFDVVSIGPIGVSLGNSSSWTMKMLIRLKKSASTKR